MPQTDLSAYLPIALMFAVVVGFSAVSLGLARRLAPRRPTPEKVEPYECGIVPLQEPAARFPVKFYLVAMLYVIFDIEIVFLFAWAASFEGLGWYGMAAVGLFTLLLIETLVYVWRRGALDWNLPRRRRYQMDAAAAEAPAPGEAA